MARRRSRKSSRKRSRVRRKRSVVKVFAANPRRRRRARRSSRRRRSYRRSYRRNPGLFNGMVPSTGFLGNAAFATGGFIGTKVVSGMVLPGLGVEMPILRILGKAVVAGALGWAGKNFLGRSNGDLILIGGMVEVVNDAVQTYVAPMVPALAVGAYDDYNMGVYPGLSAYNNMGSYVQLNGMVHDDVSEQV